FGNKNAGQAKTVTGTGFALGGADAANYSLESSTLTASADITPKPISGSFKSANKVYDGNNSAAATDRALAGTIQGDDVNLAGGKTVVTTTVAPGTAAAATYSTHRCAHTAKADITPKPISGSFKSANKVYDGNNSAAATDRALAGIVGGDDVSLTGGTASFG